MHAAMQSLLGASAAGTVSYASAEWSPVNAEVDCLGSGEDDIDREGRYEPPLATLTASVMASVVCFCR